MRLSSLIFSALLLAASSGWAAPVTVAGPGATSVDTNPATTVNLNFGTGGTIQDVNVAVNIVGNHMEDFVLSITHLGTTIQLNPFLTGHRDLFDVTFDDEASNFIQDGGNLVGAYLPYLALSAFDGMDAAGLWTLSILDAFIPDEGNNLVSWSVTADVGAAVPEPSSLALLAAGLLAAGFAARRRLQA